MLVFAAGISLSASTDVRANADMNPSLTLYSFRIWSLNLARISTTEDMSISLKVVSDAAVFWDSFRRMRFIFTRVSFLLPGAAGGGVYSGFDSFGLDGGGVGFVSIFGGVVLLSAVLAVEGRGPWAFQPPGRQPSSDSREPSRLGVWRQYL